MTEDPIEFLSGDANFYRYVLNNPSTFRDPSGMVAFVVPAIGPAIGPLVEAVFLYIAAKAALESIPEDTDSAPVVPLCTPNDPLGKNFGDILFNESQSQEPRKPKRSLDDPESLEGATPEEVKELIEESGEFEPPVPQARGKGDKYVKKGTKGSDQVLVEEGNPNADDPLHKGPYVKITKHGAHTRIPLAGNPALD